MDGQPIIGTSAPVADNLQTAENPTGDVSVKEQEMLNKLNALYLSRRITEEQREMYLKSFNWGKALYSNRKWRMGQSLLDYSIEKQLPVAAGEADDYKIDGVDLHNELYNKGKITQEDLFMGFAPQVYEAAMNGDIIVFPSDINYSSPKILNRIKKESRTQGESEEEIKKTMEERFRYAMLSFTGKQVSDTFGMYNDKSIHYKETLKKPSSVVDLIDFATKKIPGVNETKKREGADVIYNQNYSLMMNRFLIGAAMNRHPNNTYINTQNGVVSLSNNPEYRDRVLKAMNINPMSSKDINEEVKQYVDDKYRAGVGTYGIMENVEAQSGVKLYDSGFRIYDKPLFDSATSYMTKYFNYESEKAPIGVQQVAK